MTSQKQVQANQTNAKRSTGPKTAAGKSKVSTNAIKHGALSDLTVIPGLESQQEWDKHLAETVAHLRPEGRVAQWLAQQVASYQWRLRRVARYEVAAIAVGLDSAERDFAEEEFGWESACGLEELPMAKADKRVNELRAASKVLQKLVELPAEDVMLDCSQVVAEALELSGVMPEEIRSSLDTVTEWTTGLARNMLQGIAEERGMNLGDLLEPMIARTAGKLVAAQKDYKDLAQRIEHCRRQRIIPDAPVLEKIARYEVHLERGLYRALHEFREFQNQRAGQRAPAARKN